MDFPIVDLMDEQACYAQLVAWLHPHGLACPRCHRADRMVVHRRGRDPVLDFRCGHCHRVFDAFTGTALQGAQRRPRELVLIIRGFAQGVPTAQRARELTCDRSELLDLRHRLQDLACRNRDIMPLDDEVLEADETDQNAGEKRRAASRPGGPAAASGQRDTRARHLGERPAAGLRRRRAGERGDPPDRHRAIRRRDVGHGRAAHSWPMVTVHTDEWSGYNGLPEMGRSRATVGHVAGEWARDDDGDGNREVHVNTSEGLWTGLRNFLRPFRGVNKVYLYQYVAMFEWGYNVKRVTVAFVQALLGVRSATIYPT